MKLLYLTILVLLSAPISGADDVEAEDPRCALHLLGPQYFEIEAFADAKYAQTLRKNVAALAEELESRYARATMHGDDPLFEFPILFPEQERLLFEGYNYFRWRLHTTPLPFEGRSQMIDEALRVRDILWLANVRLKQKKIHSYSPDFRERIVSDATFKLRAAINAFDYRRGNKFSGYAIPALNHVIREFMAEEYQNRALPFTVLASEDDEESEFDVAERELDPLSMKTAHGRLMYSAILGALHILTAEHQRLLHLYFFEGLTHRQIADKEGCVPQNISAKIGRALEALRRYLGIHSEL